MSVRRSHSMEYEASDSSGTDDDLPPTHSAGRASRGVRVSGNGRAATGVIYASTQPASTGNMDHMIHKLELDAYMAVLRAFVAQSESITWDKERLMTDLRKELRVSDEQHREFLGKVSEDDNIRQIHSLHRQLATGNVPAMEVAPSPAVSQSRKKQKTALLPQAPLLPPPPSTTPPLPPQSKSTPVQSSSGTKRGAPGGPRGKKSKGGRLSATGKAPSGNKVGRPPSKVVENPPEVDPYIGRRVKTKWLDNAFYEAIITDYNPENGAHALVYDMDTENETWEWVDLKSMKPGDLVWVQGPNVVVGRKAPPSTTKGGIGRGMKRGPKGIVASSPGGGRTKNASKASRWQSPASENGSQSVQLMPIEDLAKEVDKLEEEEDLTKLENAKKAVRAHEEVLRKALAEVGESSDEAESAGQPPSSHTQSVDHEREHRSGQNSRDSDEDETAGNERAEHSDGEHTVGEGGNASDASEDQHGEDVDDKDEDG